MTAARGPRSIQGRATLTALLVFAVVLGVGAFAMSLGVRSTLLSNTVDTTAQKARQASVAVRQGRADEVLPANRIDRLQLVDRNGKVLAASFVMKGRPALRDMWPTAGDIREDRTVCTTSSGAGRSCFVVVGIKVIASPYGDVMIYAAEPQPPLLSGYILEIGLAAFSVALLALIGWGTWQVVGRTLAPVRRIRDEMAEITAFDLSRRTTVPPAGNEITELSESINATLNLLDQAMENQRRFASDASHELRTPLTGLRTKIELALHDPGAEDPSKTMRSVLADAERLQNIVDDLLMLARLDAGVQDSPEQIDLGELVTAEARQWSPRHEVLTHLKPDVMVRGNRLQLCRLLTNLFANADRHATSEVEVSVDSEGNEAVLEVTDDGLGIPVDQRERIFQRFTRLDSARSRDAGGTGLGLPIARDIAHAHRGTLYAADNADGRGARLILRLPLSTVIPV